MSVHSSAGCYLLLVAMVSLIISTVDVASAKRGCASFGHSCFGGHGKRSSPSELLDPEAPPTGEDYFLAPALPPLSYPYPGKAPRSLDYEMTLDPARAPNMAPLMSYLTGSKQEWTRPQQPAVLVSSSDLSPLIRQMMKSYRQHQMKSTK